VIIQKNLVEVMCEQTKCCLGNINILVETNEYLPLLLESCHLGLILDLFLSKINIKSYLEKYSILFSSEKLYIHLENYAPQISYLKKNQKKSICIEKEVHCFINILQICNDNIKKHIDLKRYDFIKDEVYYSHNIPSLIFSKKIELIKYYLTVECAECKRRCSKEMVINYEKVWQQISNQFSIPI